MIMEALGTPGFPEWRALYDFQSDRNPATNHNI
jgi:hypothetical protein